MVTRCLLAALIVFVACGPRAPVTKSGPALAVDPRRWDFGTIERGEVTATTISLTNAGPETLRLDLYSTCDCLAAGPLEAAIPPGRKTGVRLTYMGDEIKDPVTKTIFIDSNDPEMPRLAFEVTGTVTPGKAPHLVATPDPLPLDPRAPSYPLVQLRLSNRGPEVLTIDEITCFGCMNSRSQAELVQGEEVILDITPLPNWTDTSWLEIKSNDPVQPLRRITLVEFE